MANLRPKPDTSIEQDLVSALPLPVRALARRGVVRQYRAHVNLIEEGEKGDSVFVVLSGTVRIYCSDSVGKEITLALYGPGEYVGEMSLDGGPRSASVATETACTCAMVTGSQLREHLMTHPDFAMELITRLISRARLATESARSLALLDAYERLTRLFNQLAVKHTGETRIIKERLTHLAIAKRLGCTRELVSRLLKDLEVGGYVALVGKQYILVNKMPTRW